MPKITDLVGLGIESSKAQFLAVDDPTSAPTRATKVGLTSTGATLAAALELTAFNSIITVSGVSTSVRLPTIWPIGQMGIIDNRGANTVSLFPPTAAMTINGGSAGAAVTIVAGNLNLVVRVSATDFSATVLAKET